MKKTTTVRLTEKSHKWLLEQSKLQGVSLNNLIQLFINEKMNEQTTA